MAKFSGKTVIVTGAGSGIGAAAARLFSQEGATVVLAGRSQDKIDAVAEGLPASRTWARGTDVSDEAAASALIAETVERFGRLDTLVNNAGVGGIGSIAKATTEDWRRIMATNLDGVFFCCRAAVPHLIKTQGSIVNISSVSGVRGDWYMSAYNASKGGVSNFTRSLALELGPKGVRVNAVSPSLTFTEMTGAIKDNDVVMAKFKERIPLGRGAEPEDIAPAIAFLASDDARFITGVELPVDGGVTASNGQPRLF
jgi:meso-butanediol dehydrogenase/(S,S)-butanediol dehydrogenase/diacetyl reductase